MRNKTHIILPLILFAYCCVMAYVSIDTLTVEHDYLRYFGSLAVELTIIVLLYFVLKRRNQLRQERKDDMSASNKSK